MMMVDTFEALKLYLNTDIDSSRIGITDGARRDGKFLFILGAFSEKLAPKGKDLNVVCLLSSDLY